LRYSTIDEHPTFLFGGCRPASALADLASRCPSIRHRLDRHWFADGLRLAHRLRLQHRCVSFRRISPNLHGWLWIITALPGSWIGIKLRGVFRVA